MKKITKIAAAIVALHATNSFAGDSEELFGFNIGRQEPVRVTLIDYDAGGAELPIIRHRRDKYVAGIPGHRYGLRMCNATNNRVLTVISVDGVNVLSGETAGTNQSGYVLAANVCSEIKGWRKSLAQVAEFVFTDPASSYAGLTGRPQNTGIIGVAVFKEKRVPPPQIAMEMTAGAKQEAARSMANDSSVVDPHVPIAEAQRSELGTGHGTRIQDRVTSTSFERDSTYPNWSTTIQYDTQTGLIRRGIVQPRNNDKPNPWPGQFVPDPVVR